MASRSPAPLAAPRATGRPASGSGTRPRPTSRPPGSAVYITASGEEYCDVEFVEPDGDVGIWQHTSSTGWTWLAPTDGSAPVLLAPEEARVEGLNVDDSGNLVGVVPTDQ